MDVRLKFSSRLFDNKFSSVGSGHLLGPAKKLSIERKRSCTRLWSGHYVVVGRRCSSQVTASSSCWSRKKLQRAMYRCTEQDDCIDCEMLWTKCLYTTAVSQEEWKGQLLSFFDEYEMFLKENVVTFQLASRTVAEQTNNSKIAFTSSMSLKSPAFNRLFTTTDSFYFPLVQPMRWVLPVSNSTLLQKSFSFTIPEADRFQYLSWRSSGRLSLPSVPYRPQHSFVCVPGVSPMMTLPVVD